MNYDNDKAIFIQIADLICDRLLSGYYNPSEHSTSVRELAFEVQVNPNTVIRAYEKLQNENIVYNKRGIGYFFEKDAKEKILNFRRNYFKQKILPSVFKDMALLEITIEDIVNAYNNNIHSALIKE